MTLAFERNKAFEFAVGVDSEAKVGSYPPITTSSDLVLTAVKTIHSDIGASHRAVREQNSSVQ